MSFSFLSAISSQETIRFFLIFAFIGKNIRLSKNTYIHAHIFLLKYFFFGINVYEIYDRYRKLSNKPGNEFTWLHLVSPISESGKKKNLNVNSATQEDSEAII